MAKAMPVLGVDPENSLRANAALILPVRTAELLAWERYIADPACVYELHQMRIAAKRLRYTMELFAPLYGPDFEEAIGRIKAIQEMLGGIHDADVLVPDLREHLVEALKTRRKARDASGVYGTDFAAAAGLLYLCRRKRAEREKLYGRFLALWSELRAGGFFETLRQMVREEGAGNREPGTERGAKRRGPRADRADRSLAPAAPRDGEGAHNGKDRTIRRTVSVRKRSDQPGADTGSGPDSGAGAGEGGLGQHSLFEEGDAGRPAGRAGDQPEQGAADS